MDLFKNNTAGKVSSSKKKINDNQYSAKDIKVLEGLEPVRFRPGMYIGGTDLKAMQHLVTEVLDNSMDEAVAGFANLIKVHVEENNRIIIEDNGRGIPVDPHPQYPEQSALEVILTKLHSGGKFSDKVYTTSGGLHGVGVSVVNALSDDLEVQVYRDNKKHTQTYSKGHATSKITSEKITEKKHGTRISFHPDPEIFGDIHYNAKDLYKIACSRAYLYKGVKIEWSCAKSLAEKFEIPESEVIHYPNGLKDFLNSSIEENKLLIPEAFVGEAEFPDGMGKVEWAVTWLAFGENFSRTYCNTIYTPEGGTHENGLRGALLKGLKTYAELSDNKRASQITADDVLFSSAAIISVFIKNPIFQGQTKEKLLNQEAAKLVENAIKHSFEHWLTSSPKVATAILEKVIEDSEERLRRKKVKEVNRKSAIKSLRLPGKLSDCTNEASDNSEIFLVEGDSAGGSAKQARSREHQAILPLRGKILNVASNSLDKIKNNQELSDIITALGCGTGERYNSEALRYDKVIIMTDADVDGAHITSLLLTFFYQHMPRLIDEGHLYLAQPPLYKIVVANKNYYAKDDADKDKIITKLGNKKAEISRFKGLGEMNAAQLKETTMDPKSRILLRVAIEKESVPQVSELVNNLMGKNPEFRFKFIQEKSSIFAGNLEEFVDV